MSGVLSRMYHGETKINFIGRRKQWFALSAIFLTLSIGSLVVKELNYGIEFEGGAQFQASISSGSVLDGLSQTDAVTEVQDALNEEGVTAAQVQIATGDTTELLVQTEELVPEERDAVTARIDELTGSDSNATSVGSKWGGEITKKAVRALLVFFLVILAFISWRFEWKMAIAAVVALAHDLLITAGVYSIVGFEVTPSTVIAILTILGYSLYDTVVVFDKVEENTDALAATGRMTYEASANLSMNQVFMRSLNTSLVTLLPVAALLFVGAGLLGAGTLKDLALALFVGILTGTYSSIFVATPLLSLMKENEPKYKQVRERSIRDAQRASAAASLGSPVTEGGAPVPATVSSRPIGASRPVQPRAGAGDRKAKRRKKR